MTAAIEAYLGACLIVALIAGSIWAMHCLIESAIPPNEEEIARRQAERLAKQATKEFKRRQRLRAVRFWNF